MLSTEFGRKSDDPQRLDVCAIYAQRTRGGDGTVQGQLNINVVVVTCEFNESCPEDLQHA